MERMFDIRALSKRAGTAACEAVEKVFGELPAGAALDGLDGKLREAWLRAGEEVLRTAFGQVALAQRADDRRPACPRCAGATRFKQMRPCRVRTALTGEATEIESAYFVCDACRAGVLGLRHKLGLDVDGFTPRLRELAIRAGTLEPFESAAEDILGRFAGISVSGSKVHELCLEAGRQAETLMESGRLGALDPLGSGEKLVIQVDGGMLHIDGDWHEAKLAVVLPQASITDVSKDRRQVLERQVVSTLADPASLGQRLWRCVEPLLPKDRDGRPLIAGNVHVLGDGAVWIANLVEDVLPGARYLLDWYHVDEHIAETAAVLYEDEGARARWRTHQRNLLWDGRADAMVDGLRLLMMRQEAGSAAQERVAELYGYLHERRDQLWYAEARRQGLYIGSGVVESAISHVLQQRMKRSGMRWHKAGAKAIAALRCAYRSASGLDRLFAEAA